MGVPRKFLLSWVKRDKFNYQNPFCPFAIASFLKYQHHAWKYSSYVETMRHKKKDKDTVC